MNQLVSSQRAGVRLLDQSRVAGGTRPPRVSIDNGRFTLFIPGGQTLPLPFDAQGAYIDIIIIGTNPNRSKLYWGPERKFDRANPKPPLCFSDNGKAPSAAAAEPQSPTCADCPHDVWGSAVGFNGGKIKACEDFKKFSVLVKGFPGIYLFEIKGGSFKAWAAYTGMLSMQKVEGGVPDLCDVVTRVRFAGTGLLSFEPLEFVTGELAQKVLEVPEQTIDYIVGKNDVPATNVLPISEQQAARERGMPAQAPLPPPLAEAQAQTPFVLSGSHPSGPLFPQQPSQVGFSKEPAPEQPKTPRGRPKKVEQLQAQPPAPQPAPQQATGIQAPADGLPTDISGRLRSLFPKA